MTSMNATLLLSPTSSLLGFTFCRSCKATHLVSVRFINADGILRRGSEEKTSGDTCKEVRDGTHPFIPLGFLLLSQAASSSQPASLSFDGLCSWDIRYYPCS